jgi:hypothetical protein
MQQKIFLLTLLLSSILFAQTYDFAFIKKENSAKDDTLLVIGGIQGDEPGGFNAASLLATHYTITKGNVWVVPNLNFYSILKRSRGPYGDMNRKFAYLPKSDPEYETVQKIKNIIMDDQVDLVLNLHDGSGFYRDTYIDHLHNPHRWGQSCIIDQASIMHDKYGDLEKLGQQCVDDVNQNLHSRQSRFSLHNTRTNEGDQEMAKTLTYFAINSGKPAFGIEGSKSYPTHLRAYYHLLALESFMKQMGIAYYRDFQLSPKGVYDAINNVNITLDNQLSVEGQQVRRYLNYVPTEKDGQLDIMSNNPLVAIVKEGKYYKVQYGNRRMTVLNPQYFQFDHSLKSINFTIDGQSKEIKVGDMVKVNNSFSVEKLKGYRVNVIGYKNKNYYNESGITIYKNQIQKRFSIDKNGKIFRVELYKGDKFSGMVLVNFT